MATVRTSDDLLMEMVNTLECPVCLNSIWKPPIYHCEQGHIFCGECHGKLRGEGKDCPVCRQRLLGTRATAVEQIVSKLVTLKCDINGCDFLAPLTGLLASHKDSCQYRLVDCYVCLAKVALKELPEHLCGHQYHTIHIGNGPHVMSYKTKKCPPDPVMTSSLIEESKSGAQFLFYRLLFSGRYLFWVSHCQGKKEMEEYEYSISILSGKKKDQGKTFRLAKYSGLCPPMDIPLETIKAEQSCLSVTEDFLKKALNGRNSFYCELTVGVAKQDGNMDK